MQFTAEDTGMFEQILQQESNSSDAGLIQFSAFRNRTCNKCGTEYFGRVDKCNNCLDLVFSSAVAV